MGKKKNYGQFKITHLEACGYFQILFFLPGAWVVGIKEKKKKKKD